MLRRLIRDSLLFVLVIGLCGLSARLFLFPRLRAEGMRRTPPLMCHVTAFGRAHFHDMSVEEARAELVRLGLQSIWRVETANPRGPSETCSTGGHDAPRVQASDATGRWDLYLPVRKGLVLVADDVQPPRPPITTGIVLIFLGILAAAGALCSLLLRWPDARRVKLLARSARRIRSGYFDQPPVPESSDEVGQLASDFNSMSRLLAAHVLRQDSLIHAIAHEYRTPLATARFGLELLGASDTPAERQRQAARVDRALDELESIVGDVLRYAELAQGAPREAVEPTDLRSVAEEEADRAMVDCSAEVVLRGEGDAVVHGHPAHSRMVIANVLRNAVDHARSTVRVTVTAGEDEVVMDFDDDGPGISVADREYVLAPFARLSAGRSAQGVGLGLALVNQLTRLHGASLEIEDSPLGGARVRIAWPRRPSGLLDS